MKSRLLLSLALISLFTTSYSQESDEVLKLKGVLIESDYHDNITWIKSKPIPLEQKDFTVSAYDVSYIQLYFGLYMEDSVQKITPIRIVNTYKNSNWIFFDEVSYLLGSRKDLRAGNGVVFKLVDKDNRTKVDRGVSERSDVVASPEALEFVQYVMNNPEVPLECKYISNHNHESYTLDVFGGTKKLKTHFTTFVEAYNQVTTAFSLENQLTNK